MINRHCIKYGTNISIWYTYNYSWYAIHVNEHCYTLNGTKNITLSSLDNLFHNFIETLTWNDIIIVLWMKKLKQCFVIQK